MHLDVSAARLTVRGTGDLPRGFGFSPTLTMDHDLPLAGSGEMFTPAENRT